MKHALLAALLAFVLATPARAASNPVVLELFTSQSCSSCPPADALLQQLSAADPDLIALSFHVTYFDTADWKDVFSLQDSTDRQNDYARALHQANVYTPELVVNGVHGVVGSREGEIRGLIGAAKERPLPMGVTLSADQGHRTLTIAVAAPAGTLPKPADLWLVTFDPKAATAVRGGENENRTLVSIDNVTAVTKIGIVAGAHPPVMTMPMPGDPASGYAVLVQAADTGPILGAAQYRP